MENTSTLNGASGKKILIVEDEEMIRKVCASVLSKHGFDYILTSNGEEGLQVYLERHEEICLILSDVSMPVKNGLDMFRDILKVQSDANVILMSGYNITDIVPEDLRKLCSVIRKPFTSATLIQSVNKCLSYEDRKTGDSAA